MKFIGSMFKNAMTTNHIEVKNGVVTIHNTENDYGFITMFNIDEKNDEMTFTLSKKDYHTLSMFVSFDLTTKENKIFVTMPKSKITLADMTDACIPDTSLGDNTIQISVNSNDFEPGQKFVGNDQTRVQLNGVNITPTGYLITDSKCIYIHKADTGIKNTICVPKEAFKYIKDTNTCMTDGKRAAFVNNEGQLFYTSLMVVAMDMPQLNINQVCAITVNKKHLLESLKMLRGYTNELQILNDNELRAKAASETNEFDITLDGKLVKGSKLNVKVYIDDVIKIIELEKEDQVLLSFNDRMLIYQKDDTTAACAYLNQPNREVE